MTASELPPGDAGTPIDVLLCYRGRYRNQVAGLAQRLRREGLRVTYDEEILAGGSVATSAAAEVQWFNVGDAPDGGDTRWRAPLSNAIDKSYLSAFLFDARNPSVNVMNEIAWVSRGGRHIFFVIDTGSAATSEDYECIVLGMLQSWFAVARETPQPEIPRFDYHFIAHDDPQAIESRLDVLANRILSYLSRVRATGLPTLRLDNGLTLDDARDAPLERARRRLRAIQQRLAELVKRPPAQESERFRQILEQQYEREQGARVEGGRLRSPGSPFAYPEGRERQRFERTEHIIQRVRPGPCETSPVFASLARQAATIELLIEERSTTPGEARQGFHPAIVLGTMMFSTSRSVPLLSCERDNAIVLLNGTFIDFVYRVIKLTVLSWKLLSGERVTPASFDCRAEATLDTLATRPQLEEAFVELLLSYCRTSVPRLDLPAPPRPYQMPLELLIGYAERFMIAHGYAQLGLLGVPAAAAGPQEAATADAGMLAADQAAATAVLLTAGTLDMVDPMIALQGCLLAVHCDHLVADALTRFATASTAPRATAGTAHPQRVERLAATWSALARDSGMPDDDARHALDYSQAAAGTPLLLWQRTEQRFAAAAAGIPPSPLWVPRSH